MKRVMIAVWSLLVMLFALLPISTLANSQTSAVEINQLTVQGLKVLTTGGTCARWSPDGRLILYTVDKNSGLSEIRVMNRDGTGSRLIAAGRNGCWSPDGGRIAYISEDKSTRRPTIAIYDFATKKEIHLPSIEVPIDFSKMLDWSNDGRSIIVRHGEGIISDAYHVVDLNTLKATLSTDKELLAAIDKNRKHPTLLIFAVGQSSGFEFVKNRGLRSRNNVFNLVPWIGVWAFDRSGTFGIRLVPGDIREAELSPTLDAIAFTPYRGVYVETRTVNVAKIGKARVPWNCNYEVNIGSAEGMEAGSSHFVFEGKVNPLNNSIVDYVDEKPKGAVRVVSVGDHTSLVQLVFWNGIGIGRTDVVVCTGTSKFGTMRKQSSGTKQEEPGAEAQFTIKAGTVTIGKTEPDGFERFIKLNEKVIFKEDHMVFDRAVRTSTCDVLLLTGIGGNHFRDPYRFLMIKPNGSFTMSGYYGNGSDPKIMQKGDAIRLIFPKNSSEGPQTVIYKDGKISVIKK